MFYSLYKTRRVSRTEQTSTQQKWGGGRLKESKAKGLGRWGSKGQQGPVRWGSKGQQEPVRWGSKGQLGAGVTRKATGRMGQVGGGRGRGHGGGGFVCMGGVCGVCV